METENVRDTSAHATTLSLIDGVLSLSELSARLHVTAQTIYDLRSQGRGPRGFRGSGASCGSGSARSEPG